MNALRRHASDTLDVDVAVEPHSQPRHVYEWFPVELAPRDGTEHGEDPRKHSVVLSYVVEIIGDPAPRNEATEFDYFPVDDLPEPMWPGSEALVRHLLS